MTDTTTDLPPIPSDGEIENFDPIYGTPGPVQLVGNVRLSEPTLDALPPDMRDSIRAKLAGVTPGNRDIFEREYIREALEHNSLELRIKAGPGENATDYQRAYFEKLRGIYDLSREHGQIEVELAEVADSRLETDPDTGEARAVPVLRYQGEARQVRQARLVELQHKLTLLNGIEGDKLLAEGKAATIAKAKQTREQLEDLVEANHRADAKVREERIEKMADAKTRMRRPTDL
jgi:hypothetical protein